MQVVSSPLKGGGRDKCNCFSRFQTLTKKLPAREIDRQLHRELCRDTQRTPINDAVVGEGGQHAEIYRQSIDRALESGRRGRSGAKMKMTGASASSLPGPAATQLAPRMRLESLSGSRPAKAPARQTAVVRPDECAGRSRAPTLQFLTLVPPSSPSALIIAATVNAPGGQSTTSPLLFSPPGGSTT